MSDGERPVDLEMALLCAAAAWELGNLVLAQTLCDQILESIHDQPQARLLALWIARRSGDEAGFRQAAERLWTSAAVWESLPRYRNPRKRPICLDLRVLAMTGGEDAPASDISDHLPTLFYETIAQAPRLIVELGTRGGESTRTFLAAAARVGARMLSVDIEDCALPNLPPDIARLWSFERSDDIAFGESGFSQWCAANSVAAEIDLLFIDTSHVYEHTKDELRVWLPKVAPGGLVLLHDTNLDYVSERLDGSLQQGWNNGRGVIRALEEHLGQAFDEHRPFVTIAGGWLVRHVPYCGGLTSLRRLRS